MLLVQQNKKNNNIINVLMLVFCIILVSGNTKTYDYEAFATQYYLGTKNYFEISYFLLSMLFSSLGFSFDLFKFIVLGGSFLLINTVAKKYLSSRLLLYFCYLLYPLAHDAYNIRNTIAMGIVVYAIMKLTEGGRKNQIKFFGLIILAASFHKVSLVYLVFIFVEKLKNPTTMKYVFLFIIFEILGFSIFIIFHKNLLEVLANYIANLTFVETVMSPDKLGYLIHKGRFGFLLYGFINIGFIIALWLCLKVKKIRDDSYNNFASSLFYINIILLLLIPFYALNSNFFRIYRNIIVLNYIAIIAAGQRCSIKNTYDRLFFYGIAAVIAVLLFFLLVWGQRNIIFNTLFSHNWLLSF